MKLVTLSTKTTPELERLAATLQSQSETEYFYLKGIRAEISERSGFSQDALLEKIERAKEDADAAQDEADSLQSQVEDLKQENDELEAKNSKLLDKIKDLQAKLGAEVA
jgi:uncharacterized coiled-coil DUF342 family protein